VQVLIVVEAEVVQDACRSVNFPRRLAHRGVHGLKTGDDRRQELRVVAKHRVVAEAAVEHVIAGRASVRSTLGTNAM
jgi:hypothetical protein